MVPENALSSNYQGKELHDEERGSYQEKMKVRR
jgi:hypothetical protein